MTVKIIIKNNNGSFSEENNILSFSFVKDAYIPYTSLSARIFSDKNNNCDDVSEILFYVNNKLIHHGLIDTFEKKLSDNQCIITLVSRGFTSLLVQNHLQPGMITDISINKLLSEFYTIPYVTHENNDNSNNYIYVKYGSTIWDGLVNLSYKLCGTYPYIRDTNCVRITPVENPAVFTYNADVITGSGIVYNFKRRISHFHMSDINGEYGNYEITNSNVTDKKIVRNKYFELDRQFLYNPADALNFANRISERGFMKHFCIYSGYNGEDLFDNISFGTIISRPITTITIKGNNRGVFTELGTYSDEFINK